MTILEKGIFTFEGSQNTQLFNQLVVSSFDNSKFEPQIKDVKARLYFTEVPIIGSAMLFSNFTPGLGMTQSTELGKATELESYIGGTKGIGQKIFKSKITTTGTFYDWMRKTKSINGANSDVQANIYDMGKKAKQLLMNGDKSMAHLIIKVLTEGELTSGIDNLAASITPDGQALFSASHPIFATGGTQSNLVTGTFATDADKITKLTDAVNKMRNMRLANGDFAHTLGNSELVLKVPFSAMLDWSRALNNLLATSGTGTNSNAVNIFSVDGFQVRLEAEPLLGSYDSDKNIIGNTTSVYLMNPGYLLATEALKCYTVNPLNVTTDEIKDPRSFVALAEMSYGASHYWAELGIVKMTGA